jgi:hypothetical protein
MPESFRRLDDVRVIDPVDAHRGERGCIGAVDTGFVPGRPYCVNFESTSAWYGAEHIVGDFALGGVRTALEGVEQALHLLVDRDNPRPADMVYAIATLRAVLIGLVDEVEKIQKVVDL